MIDMANIPNEIEMYLNEIAGRMGQGRACVMVGAGFSKNAVKVKNTDKKFLNWNELGDLFYEKIYGHRPDAGAGRYLDALKLAGIIESSFGRAVLDKILLDNLPDEEYGPSELHKKLLELNWSDIFTTNYDTLLERTRKFVAGRKYQVVLNTEDLVYSCCPRIVKLHGSFPSERPFVISQEDYRKYPRESAAFVNTVQQALLENVMCLIGFSGDDPNFLKWLGWIRDNLGNNTSKIYLITVDSEPRMDGALLAERNIVIVNMAACFPGEKVSHKSALELFLSEIRRRQSNDNKKAWLPNTGHTFANIKSYLNDADSFLTEIAKRMKGICEFWEKSKENYPGWIIMPHKARRYFELSLSAFELYPQAYEMALEQGSDQRRLADFMKLYEWVRQVCLLTLTEKMLNYYNKVIWLSEPGDCSILDLKLAVLTFYRQSGRFQEHEEMMKSLSDCPNLPDEQKIRIYCEKAYTALYRFDITALGEILAKWPADNMNYDMELVCAGLMWECDEYISGIRRLGDALDVVRCTENTREDIKAYSKEAGIIYLMSIVSHIDFLPKDMKIGKNLTADNQFYRYDFAQEYGQGNRLDLLKAYDCDPGNEIEFFKQALLYPQVMERDEDMYYTISVQFINYLERTGMRMVIESGNEYHEQLRNAIRCISRRNLFWGIVLCLRTREERLISSVVTQGVVAACSVEQVNRIAEEILALMERDFYLISGVEGIDSTDEIPHKLMMVGRYLPRILSILVCHVSEEMKQRILRMLYKMSGISDYFGGIYRMTLGFAGSLDKCYIQNNLYEIVNLMLDAKNRELLFAITGCDAAFYELKPIQSSEKKKLWIKLEYLLQNGELDEKGRIGILYRMTLLYYAGVLEKDEIERLKNILLADIMQDNEYPLEMYYFIRRLLVNEAEHEARVKKIITGKYMSFMEDNEEMSFMECSRISKVLGLVYHAYGFTYQADVIFEFLEKINNLQKHQNSVKSQMLFADSCQILIQILLKSNFSPAEWAENVEKKIENYVGSEILKNAGLMQKKVLEGLLATDTAEFTEAAECFYYGLNVGTAAWKGQINQVLMIFCLAIKSALPNAVFCVGLTGKILRISDEVYQQISPQILSDLLEYLLNIPVHNDTDLFMKVSGAKIAYDLSKMNVQDILLQDVIDRWNKECGSDRTHAFIRKQWGDITV